MARVALGNVVMPEPLSRELSHSVAHMAGYDGYDYMGHSESNGWHAMALWGEDGWDLGAWPLVIVSLNVRDGLRWGMRIYTEGDLDTRWYASREALIAAVDDWAAWWWRTDSASRPEGFPLEGAVPERFRGPYRSRPQGPGAS